MCSKRDCYFMWKICLTQCSAGTGLLLSECYKDKNRKAQEIRQTTHKLYAQEIKLTTHKLYAQEIKLTTHKLYAQEIKLTTQKL